jgi:hypothetical protein
MTMDMSKRLQMGKPLQYQLWLPIEVNYGVFGATHLVDFTMPLEITTPSEPDSLSPTKESQ